MRKADANGGGPKDVEGVRRAKHRPAAPLPRQLRWWYWAAVGAVLLAYFAVVFHGIADYWLWGHDGFNGAAFMQAARNSLRFGILQQVQYYTGVAPPPLTAAYTHHPLMLHLHLMALVGCLGAHEWVGRLVPACYSCAIAVLLFVVAHRFWGKAVALTVVILWALAPLHLVFAHMINHEQGGIFWCLLFVYAYVRWLQQRRWQQAALCLLAFSVAAQFDWPAYYLALCLASHAAIRGLVRRRPGRRWCADWTFTTLLSLGVFVNAGAFFGWIYSLRGSLKEMLNAFTHRSSSAVSAKAQLARLFERSVDNYGWLLLAVLFSWLVWIGYRLLRRRAQLPDLIALVFFVAQLIHSTVFSQAGYIHSYWTYYLGITLALGGATTLVAAARWIEPKLRQRIEALGTARSRSWSAAAIAWFVTVVCCEQLAYAYEQTRQSQAAGYGAYITPYHDEYLDVQWAGELGRRYGRRGVTYLIHPSAVRRIEFDYYLDAPRKLLAALPTDREDLLRLGAEHEAIVLLVDLRHLKAAERQQLASLSCHAHTSVWNRRFVAVELRRQGSALTTFKARPQRPSWLYRWLVNAKNPPLRWEQDRPLAAVRQLLCHPPSALETLAGGPGGLLRTLSCPAQTVLVGLRVRTRTPPGQAAVVANIRGRCRATAQAPASPGQPTTPPPGAPRLTELPWLAPGPKLPERNSSCPPDSVVVGIHGRAGAVVDAIGLRCAQLSRRNSSAWPSPQNAVDIAAVGGPNGRSFRRQCPPEQVVIGLRARLGALLDAVTITCGTLAP